MKLLKYSAWWMKPFKVHWSDLIFRVRITKISYRPRSWIHFSGPVQFINKYNMNSSCPTLEKNHKIQVAKFQSQSGHTSPNSFNTFFTPPLKWSFTVAILFYCNLYTLLFIEIFVFFYSSGAMHLNDSINNITVLYSAINHLYYYC